MSVQAGMWNFDGMPVDQAFLGKLSLGIEQYGPDGGNAYIDGSIGMLYRAFHTTLESRHEHQPHVSRSGLIVTWDGRLDNREDLMRELLGVPAGEQTDVAIVMSAYEKWGMGSFRKLIGDWALSVWDPHEQVLVLARDYVGVRHLYYFPRYENMLWCTSLAALVLISGREFTLNDEYIAGYLALWPEAQLTPYREIHAVPPGKFVRIRDGEVAIHSYWSFDIKRQIRYKTDVEYEEHFLHVFRQAVRRRLRSDSPILAELSGGLDSSSIVCMADDIIEKGEAEVPRLDTTSRYDPEEPGGDERPYSSRVEEKRGRTGFHVDVSKFSKLFPLQFHKFVATPGSFGNTPPAPQDDPTAILQQLDHRILLSGIGGDEFMGGVPDPRPQLADLVMQFRLGELASQIMAWSLVKKTPWVELLSRSLVLLLPLSFQIRMNKQYKPAPWFDARFASRYRRAVRQISHSENFGFRLPSQRDYAKGVAGIARQMAVAVPPLSGCQEKRYPYLDQTLIEFLISIPADQLLRPGQRRSLMRRALAKLLPPEVISRATKAVTARSFMASFELQWAQLERLFRSPLSSDLGYLDGRSFLDALNSARNGNASHMIQLLRALSLELWLQDLVRRDVIRFPTPAHFSLESNLAQMQVRTRGQKFHT